MKQFVKVYISTDTEAENPHPERTIHINTNLIGGISETGKIMIHGEFSEIQLDGEYYQIVGFAEDFNADSE